MKFIPLQIKNCTLIKAVCQENLIPYLKDKINKKPDNLKSLNVIYKAMKLLYKGKIEHKFNDSPWSKSKKHDCIMLNYYKSTQIENYKCYFNKDKHCELNIWIENLDKKTSFQYNYKEKKLIHEQISIKGSSFIKNICDLNSEIQYTLNNKKHGFFKSYYLPFNKVHWCGDELI